jgi:uncharacterized protein (TIGR04255 family)
MPFPDVPRSIYEKNPLNEVICQIRFSPILKIDAEVPFHFQEGIRTDYPEYEAKTPLRGPGELPPQVAEIFAAEFPFIGRKAHEFLSSDKVWKLSLARDFLALTTKKYDEWGTFRRRLGTGLSLLNQNYHPPYFNRIGLRYQNVIRRSDMGLSNVPWSDLLNPAVSGPLGSVIDQSVLGLQTRCLINLSEEIGQVQVHYALLDEEDSQENVFVIDADFFNDKQTEPSNVFKYLDAFNKRARDLFQWSIKKRLHDAMGPILVSAQ